YSDLTSIHALDQTMRVERFRLIGADGPAIAQHSDAVGKIEHFAELVGDVNHSAAAFAQPPQNPEQHFSLGIRERGGWLIEHENPRVARQRLGDLHEMLLADAEVADGNVRLEVEVQQLEDFLRAAVEIRRLNDAAANRLASEENIL